MVRSALFALSLSGDILAALGVGCNPASGDCPLETAADDVSMLAASIRKTPASPWGEYAKWLKSQAEHYQDELEKIEKKDEGGTITCTAKRTTVWCSARSTCCDKANAALCGGAGSTCCYNHDFSVANICAPGTFCYDDGHCYSRPPNPPQSEQEKALVKKTQDLGEKLVKAQKEAATPKGTITCTAKKTTVWCSASSTCCNAANAALCGGSGSTCCYNPEFTVANLCAPGSFCHSNGHCYAKPEQTAVPDQVKELAQQFAAIKRYLKKIRKAKEAKEAKEAEEASKPITCAAKKTTLWCAAGTTCCDQANAALCGGAGSTCCYNHDFTVANLCSPGTYCYADGHCYAAPPQSEDAKDLLEETEELQKELQEEQGALTAPSGTQTCTAKQTTVWCAASSVCCNEANAALCGGEGSTCCYNPDKTIANLCAPGSTCLPSGHCKA